MTHLLPYFEEGNLRSAIVLSKNWAHANNRAAVGTVLETLLCPSSPEEKQRLDGVPESLEAYVPEVAAVTDYSPTIWVDKRLASANLADKILLDETGAPADVPGIMEYNNPQSSFKLVTDG